MEPSTAGDRQGFFKDNYPYLTPAQRAALAGFNKNNEYNLLDHLKRTEAADTLDVDVAIAYGGVLRRIRKFRYPHLKVTRDNFNLRPEGSVGSGAYTPAILEVLLAGTEADLKTVQTLRQNK